MSKSRKKSRGTRPKARIRRETPPIAPPPRAPRFLGIAGQLALISFGLLSVLLTATSILTFRVSERGTRAALERQGDAIASTLNHTFEVLVDHGELTGLQRVAANTAFLPDVSNVTVVDAKGKVLASIDRRAVGKPAKSERLRAALGRDDFAPQVFHDTDRIVFIRPLFSGRYADHSDSGLVGAVEVELDKLEMQADADETALGLLGVQLGGYALLSVLVALALRTLVVRPLGQLATVAKRTQGGDRSARMGRRSRDELGVVSEAFDAMAAEVERTVATLEDQVAARTKALAEEVEARTEALAELEEAHAQTNRVNEDLYRAKGELERALDGESRANDELRVAKGELERALDGESRANDELRVAKGELERALDAESRANDELRVAKGELERALDASMHANEALVDANDELERAHGELFTSIQEQIMMAETITELSTPVMRVFSGVITMPLVGKIDEARAKQVETKLLAGIERHDATDVILDLSGVPDVDVDVARAIVRARRCAELVGARVTLVGLRADVAKSVVRSGVDLSGQTTLADLESAIARTLGRRGLEIRRRASAPRSGRAEG